MRSSVLVLFAFAAGDAKVIVETTPKNTGAPFLGRSAIAIFQGA
jgi:hypothetical protein